MKKKLLLSLMFSLMIIAAIVMTACGDKKETKMGKEIDFKYAEYFELP